jgi:ComEC/Rec2-related protein
MGKIESIKEYESGSKRVILSSLNIFQGKSNKANKARKNNTNLSKKRLKINKNTLKSYLNLDNYTQIDRNLGKPNGFESFIDGRLQNTPRRITLSVRKPNQIFKIGDIITTKAFLQPISKINEIDSFDFEKYYYFKQIGATGFSNQDIRIIESDPSSSKNKVDLWRYRLAEDIRENFEDNENEASIFIALALGIRDFIPKDLMVDIRKSGLAHLLAISGLHMSLAAAIFFVFFRFLLSRSESITLNFNIKKISAVLAILSSFSYLIIAGSPIPAIRAFLIILVFFLAMLLDKNPNPLRSLALAALIILIINPGSIYSIGFQMSFTAILALVAFYNYIKRFNKDEGVKNIIVKFIYYFLGIVASSIIAQIALAPLIIYYFNNYSLFGVLANLVAIPITTFVVMPLAFIYLSLSIFNFETITIYPLNIALTKIIQVASFTANLKFSNITIPLISSLSLILMMLGFLWLCLWQERWRYFGIIIILCGFILAIKTPRPDFIIDGNRQFFAINDKEKGLFFSKKVRRSMRVKNLIKKLGEDEFRIIDELDNSDIFCEYEYCEAKIKDQQILILTKRNKIDFICKSKFDILVNISKFKLPNCLTSSKKIINSSDLERLGTRYLYF